MANEIQHLTLLTEHSRRSWRHEVSPSALAASHTLLAKALRDDAYVPLTYEPRIYSMRAAAEGGCVICTVYAHLGEHVPLVTFAVAAHSRCGASVWRALRQGHRRTPQPRAPWCAVRIEPGLMQAPDATLWLGELERHVAWAWLDSAEDDLARQNSRAAELCETVPGLGAAQTRSRTTFSAGSD